MEKENLNIEEFLQMFMAVSYLCEQRYFNIDNLKEYIKVSFELDNDLERTINNKIDCLINKLCNEEVISRVPCFKYLIIIKNNYPYMEIVKRNYSYVSKVSLFLKNFINYSYLEYKNSIKLPEEEIDPFDIKKNYVKKKTV